MTHIHHRLQKVSGEAIAALPGPTPVKAGERTVGLMLPIKAAGKARLASFLAGGAPLAKGRYPAADAAALAEIGVDAGSGVAMWSMPNLKRAFAHMARPLR